MNKYLEMVLVESEWKKWEDESAQQMHEDESENDLSRMKLWDSFGMPCHVNKSLWKRKFNKTKLRNKVYNFTNGEKKYFLRKLFLPI